MAIKQIPHNHKTYTISYELLNPTAEKDLLILHGWGSRKEIMRQAFGKLLPGYRHVYLDLPGFGKSPTDQVLTTKEYAAIVETFCNEVGVKKQTVIGHSFGGKVGVLLNPETLVLLSSAGIPVKKRLSGPRSPFSSSSSPSAGRSWSDSSPPRTWRGWLPTCTKP